MNNNITIVSTAVRKDLPIWKLTQNSLLENLPGANINLIVPELDYKEFKKNTNNEIKLHNENKILDYRELRKSCRNKRFNWYYQQFLKLYFFKDVDTDYGIIWDADTFMIKNIPIVKNNKIIINTGREKKHQPYCETINRLLGTCPHQDISFISQFIAFKIEHLKDFLLTMESSNKEWVSEIIKSEKAHELIFSEYETLVTYLLMNHPFK